MTKKITAVSRKPIASAKAKKRRWRWSKEGHYVSREMTLADGTYIKEIGFDKRFMRKHGPDFTITINPGDGWWTFS